MTETERAVVCEAMCGQPLRLRALAEDLATRGCGVAEVKRQVEAVARAMSVECSPSCPHCRSINTRGEGPGRWRCGRNGCLAVFTDAETEKE